SIGGGDKSNRLLMEALAARGHEVHVVARLESFGEAQHTKLSQDLQAHGIDVLANERAAVFHRNGVEVHTLSKTPQLRAYLAEHVRSFNPDVIVTSTDDPGQLLLGIAMDQPRPRVVYLIRATIAVPFGPDASSPSARKTEILRHVDGVIGVSQYVADYA